MSVINAFVAPTAVKTAAYAAQDGDFVPVDTTSAGVTVTLPSPAHDRSVVAVKLVKGGNTLTVNCGGSDTFNDSAGTTFTTGTLNQGVVWQYSEASGIWYALSGDVTSSGMTNPMTTAGDLIYENATPAAARLAAGSNNQILTVVSGVPAWQSLDGTAGDIAAPGTQAAGSVGKAADAGHVHPAKFTAAGYIAPAVVALTDAATITVDASQGNDQRVTLGGNRTMGSPSNAVDGQHLVFHVTQDGTGSRTLAWTTGSSGNYEFSASLAAPTLSTAASAVDVIGFIYNTAKARWLCVGYVLGF